MSIRNRAPGLSPLVCIRGGHSRLRFYQTPNTTSQIGGRSIYKESLDVPRENRKDFSSVLSKHNVQSSYLKNIRFQCVSEFQRSRFSTSTRQHAGSASVLEEEHFDVSPNSIAKNDSLPDLEKLTVRELRDLLSSRSLKTSGLKSELIARLRSSNVDILSTRNTDTPDSSTPPVADHQLDDSMPLQKMTVKELKSRLFELGLPTTGLKNELVERLVSVQLEEPQTEVPIATIIDQIAETPVAETTPDALPPTETGVVVDVSETHPGHDSIVPQNIKSVPSVSKSTSSLFEAVKATEFPTETAMPDIPMEPAQPEITPSQSSLDQTADTEHVESSKLSPINHLAQMILISALNERLSATELSTLRLIPDLIARSTKRAFAENLQPSHRQILSTPKTHLVQKPHRLSSNALYWRLQKSAKRLARLESQLNDLTQSPNGETLVLPPETSKPLSLSAEQRTALKQRTIPLAEIYFSRAFEKGIAEGPETTEKMRFIEFSSSAMTNFREIFLEIVLKLVNNRKSEENLVEQHFIAAWKLALHRFSIGEGKYYLQPPDAERKRMQLDRLFGRDHPLMDPNPCLPDQKVRDMDAKVSEKSGVGNAVRMTPGDSQPRAISSYETNAAEREPIRTPSINRQLLTVARQTLHKMRERLGPDAGDRNVTKWNRSMVESLAANPITIRLTITEQHRRKFLLKPESEHTVGNFITNGDPFCQIFNSMWIKLGLINYIDSIQPTDNKLEFNVTFKSFEAASAFVNQVDKHFLDDPMIGQIYATWESEEQNEHNTTAIIMFPRRTLEVWRKEALHHNAQMSPHGYPLVEWTKSLWTILTRMRLSIGRHGDCRRYRILDENHHRVVMEMSFKNGDMLNHFLERKKEHYLTNAWKDRFFAKRHVRLG